MLNTMRNVSFTPGGIRNRKGSRFMFMVGLIALFIPFLLSFGACSATAEESPQINFQYLYADDSTIYLDIRNQTTDPIAVTNIAMTTVRENETDTCYLYRNGAPCIYILPGQQFCIPIDYSVKEGEQVSFTYDGGYRDAYEDASFAFITEAEARIRKEDGLLKDVVIKYENPTASYIVWPEFYLAFYDDHDRPVYSRKINLSERMELCPPFGHLWIRWRPFAEEREVESNLFYMLDQVSYVKAFTVWEPQSQYEYQMLEDGTVEITGMTLNRGDITVPAVIDGYKVSSIAPCALQNNDEIKNVVVAEGIRHIGDYAFQNCDNLTRVYLPASIETIGENPFQSCDDLETINFQNGNERFTIAGGSLIDVQEQRLIAYPLGREDIQYQIPENVRSIGADAFAYDFRLSQIIFPKGLTEIDDYAFSYCALSSVTLPKSLRRLGANPFCGCEKLKEIVPEEGNSEISIQNGVLYAENGNRLVCYPVCLTDREYTIPEGTVEIGDSAFEGQGNLEKISWPHSVVSIGNQAFCDCYGLTELILPVGIQSIGSGAFYGCSGLTTVQLPAGLSEIKEETFYNCESLAEISLPDSVKRIGYEAFSSCSSLRDLSLPAGLQEIDETAFDYCENLSVAVVTGSYAERFCLEKEIPIWKAVSSPDDLIPTEEPFPEWLMDDSD